MLKSGLHMADIQGMPAACAPPPRAPAMSYPCPTHVPPGPMKALNFLRPLGQAARAFFKHDLALRREADGVRIVLEARGAAKTETRQSLAERRTQQTLDLIRTELAAVLGEVPGTRAALRHLAFVEQALARKGLRAIDKLPLDVLRKALEQLESLVTNWSPAGLATLRAKMAVALIDREHQTPEEAEEDAYRTAAVLDPGLDSCPAQAVSQVEVEESDEAALAAAYAALGGVAPAGVVEMQGELGSPSARAPQRVPTTRTGGLGEIKLRELES